MDLNYKDVIELQKIFDKVYAQEKKPEAVKECLEEEFEKWQDTRENKQIVHEAERNFVRALFSSTLGFVSERYKVFDDSMSIKGFKHMTDDFVDMANDYVDSVVAVVENALLEEDDV